MYSRVSQHLQTNYILAPEQYAFRKGKSTEDAAFGQTESVLKYLNQKLYDGGIFWIIKGFWLCKSRHSVN